MSFWQFSVHIYATLTIRICQYLILLVTFNIATYHADDPNDPDNLQSHTWLLVRGLIVDITCDQFKTHNTPLKCNKPIYIGPASDYYRQFDTGNFKNYLHHGLDKNWPHYNQLRLTYETIKSYL